MPKKKDSPFPPGTLVAFYSRDSGGDEQELSTQRQQAEFVAWCEAHQLIPGEIFVDEARPGSTTVGRAEFLRMIRHFRSGAAREAGLVVWRFSRFGRNANDRKYYKADIRRLGYKIHSLSDNIPDDRFGALIEDILDWKDQYFLEELSEEVSSGLKNIVLAYGCVPGKPPRGFTREPVTVSHHRTGKPRILHKWVPDPTMIDLVRRAFHMLVRGETLKNIHAATGLYKGVNGYKTFFRNPLYKGVLHYKDLIIPDYCEPIIEDAVWERAQRILDARAGRKHVSASDKSPSGHPRRAESPWLLSGLARCARCGAPLNGNIIKQWTYYRCDNRVRRRDCDAPQIPAPHLERAVIDKVHQYLNNPSTLAVINTQRLTEYEQAASQLPARQKELSIRLANLRRQITNLTEAIAQHGHSAALLDQLTAFEVQEYQLTDEYDEIIKVLDAKPEIITPERVKRLAARFERVLANGTIEQQRELLQAWIHSLQAEREGNTILARLDLYIPPHKKKLGLYNMTPWGHCLIALQIKYKIPYKKRGRKPRH